MKWFEIYDIAEENMKIINPTTREKIIKAGEISGFSSEKTLIDFGSGFAENLVIWAEEFGINSLGIEMREYAHKRAEERVKEKNLQNKIELVHGDAKKYDFKKNHYDIACAVGTSFIWENLEKCLSVLKSALKEKGILIVGEVYWKNENMPLKWMKKENFSHEYEIFKTVQKMDLDIIQTIRSTMSDWDNYEYNHHRGLIEWLENNKNHPDYKQVKDSLREWQEDYHSYIREYLGWAIFILKKSSI